MPKLQELQQQATADRANLQLWIEKKNAENKMENKIWTKKNLETKITEILATKQRLIDEAREKGQTAYYETLCSEWFGMTEIYDILIKTDQGSPLFDLRSSIIGHVNYQMEGTI